MSQSVEQLVATLSTLDKSFSLESLLHAEIEKQEQLALAEKLHEILEGYKINIDCGENTLTLSSQRLKSLRPKIRTILGDDCKDLGDSTICIDTGLGHKIKDAYQFIGYIAALVHKKSGFDSKTSYVFIR